MGRGGNTEGEGLLAQGILLTGDGELDPLIARYAKEAEAYRGQDMCGFTAASFARLLSREGIESEVIQYGVPEWGVEHEVCFARGFLCDFSAEQFGEEFDYPFIARSEDDYAELGLYLQEQKRIPYFVVG